LFFQDIKTIISKNDYEAYYIRHFTATKSLVNFLKNRKKQNPSVKILLEIPTYPYEAEYQGVLEKTALLTDRYHRRKLSPWVDYIIHYGPEKTIWNIPCIGIQNGIYIPQNISFFHKREPDKINLIAIGNVAYWWGLEELIASLNNYQKNSKRENVCLKIVGTGKEIKKLKALVKTLKLAKIVSFVPYTTGKDLEDLLMKADIGIGTLHMHKKNLNQTSSLKHRLYAAYGLPFIYRGKDADFGNPKWNFQLKDDQLFSIPQLIAWFENIQPSPLLRNEIHKYASNNLSWAKKMKPVLDLLKKG
jgi:hypothetical protein